MFEGKKYPLNKMFRTVKIPLERTIELFERMRSALAANGRLASLRAWSNAGHIGTMGTGSHWSAKKRRAGIDEGEIELLKMHTDHPRSGHGITDRRRRRTFL